MKTNLRRKMRAMFNTQIRKALYGIMLLVMVFSTLGTANLPAAHAEVAETETQQVILQPVFLLTPPADCNSNNVIVQNPYNASSTVEAKFCEGLVPGSGELWLHNNTQVAHVVRILPDPGILNLAPLAIITWGPNYWFKVAENVQIHPGEKIVIDAKRFGNTSTERIAAINAHITLIGELLFIGSTPDPNLSRADTLYRYGLSLADTLGADLAMYIKCGDAFDKGDWYPIVDCLIDIGKSDTVMDSIVYGLLQIGIIVSKDSFKLAYLAVNKIKDMTLGLARIINYIYDTSNATQDVSIIVTYPGTPGLPPPPPTCSTCPDAASFIADITLPDGTVVSPGQSLTKTWRIKNTGTTTWGSGYQLAFTGGEQMGAPSAVNVPATTPGLTADISVTITAPTTIGSHAGYWRLRNPEGTYFGDKVWAMVIT